MYNTYRKEIYSQLIFGREAAFLHSAVTSLNHNFYRVVAQGGNPQFRSILGNFIDDMTRADIVGADFEQMQLVMCRYTQLFEVIFKKD